MRRRRERDKRGRDRREGDLEGGVLLYKLAVGDTSFRGLSPRGSAPPTG